MAMLYVVMLPIGRDKQRNVTVISAPNYAEVRKVLGLPNGWTFFVSLTDIELDAVKQSPLHYKTLLLCRETY